MIREAFSPKYLEVLDSFGLSDFPRELLSILHFSKKEYIFQQGCPVSYLLIILEGRAKVVTFTEEGRTLLHSFSHKGGLIGEVEMLTEVKNAGLYVQAVNEVSCLGIAIPEGTKLLKSNLFFMNRLSTLLARKLVNNDLNSSRNILYPLESRLCSYIEMTSPGGCFEEQLTQTAELLGTSYRHLLRTLEKLCQEQVLTKSGHKYFIADASALHSRGQGFYSIE